MLQNYDGFGHLKIGDICRFEKNLGWGQSCLNIPELYEEKNWMVIAFGIGNDVDSVYLQRFHDRMVVKISTATATVNRLECSRQGRGGFCWQMRLLRKLKLPLYTETVAVLAQLRKEKLTK